MLFVLILAEMICFSLGDRLEHCEESVLIHTGRNLSMRNMAEMPLGRDYLAVNFGIGLILKWNTTQLKDAEPSSFIIRPCLLQETDLFNWRLCQNLTLHSRIIGQEILLPLNSYTHQDSNVCYWNITFPPIYDSGVYIIEIGSYAWNEMFDPEPLLRHMLNIEPQNTGKSVMLSGN